MKKKSPRLGEKPPYLDLLAVSGGPDSIYMLHSLAGSGDGTRYVVGHVNHGVRGAASEKDQELVQLVAASLGISCKVRKDQAAAGRSGETGPPAGGHLPGFEEKARESRYRYLEEMKRDTGAWSIHTAHTADDQVETILMRFFEGAGIAGLKGIPRETVGAIVRPILHVWKEDVFEYLKENEIPFRVDRSNRDTRFERNWVRHVLIPLLVKRYGKGVNKRIFTLGERFRELDEYLESQARKWMKRHLVAQRKNSPPSISFRRSTYSCLPIVLRVKVLQKICFERLGVAPNERLLQSMDRSVREGGPSARVRVGQGWELANRYEATFFVPSWRRENRLLHPGGPADSTLSLENRGKVTPAQAKRSTARGDREIFDASSLRRPLTVRPLQAGDRIRPFGLEAEKKVKEILIDRKVPREERWGRPVVCDANGEILWIPGVVRSAHAPVTANTRRTILLKRVRKSPGKISRRAEPFPRTRK